MLHFFCLARPASWQPSFVLDSPPLFCKTGVAFQLPFFPHTHIRTFINIQHSAIKKKKRSEPQLEPILEVEITLYIFTMGVALTQ